MRVNPLTHVSANGARYHVFQPPPRGRIAAGYPWDDGLLLACHGGPVLATPRVYVDLWGDWSPKGDPDDVHDRVFAFLQAIGGSAWLNTVTQYYQGRTHVGNPANLYRGAWNDTATTPPPTPSDADIANEALRAAQHFGDLDPNAHYVVAMPTGIVPQGFGTQYCAYHGVSSGGITFTNLPYMPDVPNCGANWVNGGQAGILDGVSIVLGHEVAEAVTDPTLTAWYDAQGWEIGDKCAWFGIGDNPNAGGFPTQPLWSNAAKLTNPTMQANCVQF